MTRKERKSINVWIELRKKELQKAKVKFTDYSLNDWIEIPDYKISELNNFQRFFNHKRKPNNLIQRFAALSSLWRIKTKLNKNKLNLKL